MQPPLGLSMIVKNEADYIAQTLLSVKPHIDYWTVVDTGKSCATGRRCYRTSSSINQYNTCHPDCAHLTMAAPYSAGLHEQCTSAGCVF